MSKLLLIGGNFFKDGKKVPVTFGDKEQIALMEEYDLMMNEGRMGCPIKGGWKVTCFCGEEVIFKEEEYDDMDGNIKKCKCGLRYVCCDHEDKFLTIKLKPRKL